MIFKFKWEKNGQTIYIQNMQDLADELEIHYQTLRKKIKSGQVEVEEVDVSLTNINDFSNGNWTITLNGIIICKK